MNNKVAVNLRPIISNINLPTVVKAAMLPGDSVESIFVATQPGEIFNIRNGQARLFWIFANGLSAWVKTAAMMNGVYWAWLLTQIFITTVFSISIIHWQEAKGPVPSLLLSGQIPVNRKH